MMQQSMAQMQATQLINKDQKREKQKQLQQLKQVSETRADKIVYSTLLMGIKTNQLASSISQRLFPETNINSRRGNWVYENNLLKIRALDDHKLTPKQTTKLNLELVIVSDQTLIFNLEDKLIELELEIRNKQPAKEKTLSLQ